MQQAQSKSLFEILGLPDEPKTGRERLVAAAVELFYRQGFGAVGVDQVIAKAGVTKTTFYKHFESKDDLMVAAVQRRDEWESQGWDRAIRKIAGDDPVGQLLAKFDVMDLWFNDPEFRGCMFMNAAAEFPNPHDPVHQAAASFISKNRNQIRKLSLDAGASAESAEAFADQYMMIAEGAFILRQTQSRNDAAKIAKTSVELLVEKYLKGPVSELPATPSVN